MEDDVSVCECGEGILDIELIIALKYTLNTHLI